MASSYEPKTIVERIGREIEESKGTRIWDDYTNALKLIAQTVFMRSSGFILEFIQNAEDAGLGLESSGVFEIRINRRRVKVVHNGCPFNEDNVKALCGVRSSKKPEKGTLGYLGIGFKSVFKISDCPEIYSGGFQFKFDRNHSEWKEPNKTPWHILPIWIDQPSEAVDTDKTSFVIPLREESYYRTLIQEVGKLSAELYLFLRWLKRIEVVDEISGRTRTLENLGDEEGITTLRHDGQEQRFRIFRRTLQVDGAPDWVKGDRLTQDYRANVVQREILVAFALDNDGNLAPVPAGAMYGGVYSYVPLGEAKSGAKFPIQADFLVQPGRDAINYEAKWNHWLVEEIASLCTEAIGFFSKHDKWKYQLLPLFEFTKSRGDPSYDSLFGPKLVEPIEKFLREEECVPLVDGGWGKLDHVVRLSEDAEASEDLEAMGVLKREEIAPVLGGRDGLKLVHRLVADPYQAPIRKVNRQGLLSNNTFLEKKRQQPDAASWFRSLYLWLAKHPVMYKSGRSRYPQGYHDAELVLTANGKLCRGREVLLPDLPPSDPILGELSDTLQRSKPVLHADILSGTSNKEDQNTLRGFLLGLTGVQLLDGKAVCRDALLPRILTTGPKPRPDDLLKYTTYCQQILGEELPPGLEFWVLTKSGDVRPAKETLLPKEFKPEQDWETHQQYVSGLSFVSTRYLPSVIDDDQLRACRQFFKNGGVRDAPDRGIEEFAMNYAMQRLGSIQTNVKMVDKRNFGYDIEAENQAAEIMRIEVKGLSHDQDVELDRNETDTADKHKDSFYLCVVSEIPGNPEIYLVKNPAMVGKKEKVTIPSNIWKTARLA